MDDIRLEEKTMELDGKTFKLRANFNVMCDAQKYFGDFKHLEDPRMTFERARAYLSFMMNDYADEMGWPERYTPAQAGRLMQSGLLNMIEQTGIISELITGAVFAKRDEASAAANP